VVEVAAVVVPYELGRLRDGVGCGPEHLLERGAVAALASAGADLRTELIEMEPRVRRHRPGRGRCGLRADPAGRRSCPRGARAGGVPGRVRGQIVHLGADRLRSPDAPVTELRAMRPAITSLYVHLDLDVLDSAEATGNIYAASDGVRADELVALVEVVVREFPVGGVSLTAYDPSYDDGDRVPPIANRLLASPAAAAGRVERPARARPRPDRGLRPTAPARPAPPGTSGRRGSSRDRCRSARGRAATAGRRSRGRRGRGRPPGGR